MRIIIVGSGIAGSATRLTLQRLGASVKVYERAPSFFALGAGLTLAPNGLAVIDQLGLLEKVKALSQPEREVKAFDDKGRQLGGVDFHYCEPSFKYPLLGLTRHDLQTLLMEGAEPGKDVVFGKKCVAVAEGSSPGLAKVVFDDGTWDEADMVVGADGNRSAVSAYVTGKPAEELVRYSGYISTLGITQVGLNPDASSGEVTWVYGPGRTWGTWCLSQGRYFWFTCTKASGPSTATWSSKLLDQVKQDFKGSWHLADGGFDQVLAGTERATSIALTDRAGHKMTKGRVCLVGDAAHAVTPWGGQGGNLALEDAACLANQLLRANGDVPRALKGFEEARLGRSRKVAELSKVVGDLQMSEAWWGPMARRVAVNVPSWMNRQSIAWIYGHQPVLQAGKIK